MGSSRIQDTRTGDLIVIVRPYLAADAGTLYAIFVEAVHVGAADHYTRAQRHAWAPDQQMPHKWPEKLALLDTWVAEINGETAGFMSITDDGYIDLAFVRPRWMGRAVAQTVYERIVELARIADTRRLTTHASHPARNFFTRNGWQLDSTEMIDRNGEALMRFAMSLTLKEEHDHPLQPRKRRRPDAI